MPVTKRLEQAFNIATHGVGVPLGIAAFVTLVNHAANGKTAAALISAAIYGGTLLFLYLASTLMHCFAEHKTDDVFVFIDHAAIYLFIAGTYTPIMLHVVGGTLGPSLLRLVWVLAAAGMVFKIFFPGRFTYLSTLFYLLMGWLIVVAWGPLTAHLPSSGMSYLVTGGLLYSIGTIFYQWRIIPFNHAVWHLFVLAGSACHFYAILRYVLP